MDTISTIKGGLKLPFFFAVVDFLRNKKKTFCNRDKCCYFFHPISILYKPEVLSMFRFFTFWFYIFFYFRLVTFFFYFRVSGI